MARDRGLTVGRDLIFNYGPWGFLNIPIALTHGSWLAAVSFRLAAQLALFGGIAVWIRGGLSGWRCFIPALPLLLFLPPVEYRWLLALVLWIALLVGARRSFPAPTACLGLIAAASVMIKFSMGVAAMMVVAGGVLALLTSKRARSALTLAAGFGAGVIIWGTLALGSIDALFEFLRNSIEISTGYESAMERRGPMWQPPVIAFAMLACAWAALRGNDRVRALAFPSCGLLAITFKHAFIRHETHAFLAFTVGSVLLVWLMLAQRSWLRMRAGVLLLAGAGVLLGAFIVQPPTDLLTRPLTALRYLGEAAAIEADFADGSHRSRVRAELRQALPLHPGAREMIGDRTVDILTVEVALAEGWELNWRPRPVLQSYAVATRALDELDAAHFASDRAPEILLVDLQGLDTRHPFMDAPLTWREILLRYDPLGRDERWMILGRRDEARQASERSLGSLSLPMNHVASAPESHGGHVEMRVRLEPTLWGRLVAIPWKLPEVRLGVAGESKAQPRRILAATADRPFPVTGDWPVSATDLWRFYAEPEREGPNEVWLVTSGSWAWKPARIEFLQVSWNEPD